VQLTRRRSVSGDRALPCGCSSADIDADVYGAAAGRAAYGVEAILKDLSGKLVQPDRTTQLTGVQHDRPTANASCQPLG
jgi:hypothetical protein